MPLTSCSKYYELRGALDEFSIRVCRTCHEEYGEEECPECFVWQMRAAVNRVHAGVDRLETGLQQSKAEAPSEVIV